jgi:hypothetical protein
VLLDECFRGCVKKHVNGQLYTNRHPDGYSKVTQSFKTPSTTPAALNTAGTTGTYNKKTGAAKLGNKTMLAFKDLSQDLPPNIQKQLALMQQLRRAVVQNLIK